VSGEVQAVKRRWSIVEADVVDALRIEPDASFDALLSDVPYGLGNREPTLDELVAYLRGESSLNTGGDFMGKKWSVPSVAFWREAMRVLKPGAPLLVFAGTRTQDLISMGMRAAGFEIRDCLDWVYASGFPKSLDVSKAIDAANGDERVVIGPDPSAARRNKATSKFSGAYGTIDDAPSCPETAPASDGSRRWSGYGTALKPAREPVILARKPLEGTVVENVLTYGTGALNIDGCRIGYASQEDQAAAAAAAQRLVQDQNAGRTAYGRFDNGAASLPASLKKQDLGRWPANLAFSHTNKCRVVGETVGVRPILGAAPESPVKSVGFTRGSKAQVKRAEVAEVAEVYECVDGCPVKLLDEQSGNRPGMSGGGVHRDGYGGGMFGGIDSAHTARGDSGGASRFFATFQATKDELSAASFRFVSKASRGERELGCEHLPARKGHEVVDRDEGSAGLGPRAGAGRTADEVRNYGPCVKPIELTRWLATLVLPPPRRNGQPRRLLVPYCGTGSEMIGALRAGWEEVVGIQRVADDEERGYVAIAKARLTRWDEVPASMDEGEVVAASEKPDVRQTSLFGASQ
jgi:hypothetical protein